jgi:hypothetical protein
VGAGCEAVRPSHLGKLTALKKKMMKASEAELRELGIWEDFFDQINATVQDLTFKLAGGVGDERPTVRLLKNVPGIGTAVTKAGPVATVAWPLLKAGAKLRHGAPPTSPPSGWNR